MDDLYDLYPLQCLWFILVWLATKSIEGLRDSMGEQVDGVYIIR